MDPSDAARWLEGGGFYHVTSDDDLAKIAATGLQPGAAVDRTNFTGYTGLDNECVYLWPNIGQAQSYVFEDTQKLGAGKHRLLRVDEIDTSKIFPDNERLGDRIHDEVYDYFDHENEPGPLMEILKGAGWTDDDFRAYRDYDSDDESWPRRKLAEQAREYLRTCPDDVRIQLAVHFAEQGEALMYRGTITPDLLEIATLLDFEQLSEDFSEQHPELNPWDGETYHDDIEEQRQEAFDEWLEELMAEGKEFPPDLKTLRELVSDPSECVYSDHERFFAFKPLNDAISLTPPQLLDLDDPAPIVEVDSPARNAHDDLDL